MSYLDNPTTKIAKILIAKKLSQKKFLEKINKKFPDQPMSWDHLSRIISGNKKSYNTTTLYKMCAVLRKSPNQLLDFEDQI